jgi:hypothetical protein
VRGSVSNYVDVDLENVARHTLGSQAQRKCKWNTDTQAYDKDCAFSGGLTQNTFGRPCGPSGVDVDGTDCNHGLKIPRTWEYTLGGEREMVPGIALALDLVYRKYVNQYETRETNRIWNPQGTELARDGGYKNGRKENVTDLDTPDDASRQYVGVTSALIKREGRVKANLAYTWSQLQGNVFNGQSNPWGDIPGRDVYLDGYLPDDHRHEVKANVQFLLTNWLSMGVRYSYMSGFPYSRLFRNDESGSFEYYRAQIGVNPGSNLNDPADDRPLRLPDRQELNTQIRVSLLPLIGQRLDFYVDMLNVLGLRTATSISQNDGQDFGVERGWLDPFRMRLGVNFRY